jgi:hypothetical protein
MSERESKGIETNEPEDDFYEKYRNKSIVYCLLLKDGYRYVGRTTDLHARIEKHKQEKTSSSSWLFHHPYVKIEKIYELKDENGDTVPADAFLEDCITFKMMVLHGLEKVRGGNYCKVVLEEKDSNDIKKILDSQDACYSCGSKEHMWKTCPLTKCRNQNCKSPYGHIFRECPSVICWRCQGNHFQADCQFNSFLIQ